VSVFEEVAAIAPVVLEPPPPFVFLPRYCKGFEIFFFWKNCNFFSHTGESVLFQVKFEDRHNRCFPFEERLPVDRRERIVFFA